MNMCLRLNAAVLPFLCFLHGAKGQQNPEIIVYRKVHHYGQNLHLLCKFDKCCPDKFEWQIVNKLPIFLNINSFHQENDPNKPLSRYIVNYDDRGISLFIKQFSSSDLFMTHTCGIDANRGNITLRYNDVFDGLQNPEIIVDRKVNTYGQNLLLLCKIDGCCKTEASWKINGTLIFKDIKTFVQPNDTNYRYPAIYDDRGIWLIIRNFSKSDLNQKHECFYNSTNDTKTLSYDDVFSDASGETSNNENTTADNTFLVNVTGASGKRMKSNKTTMDNTSTTTSVTSAANSKGSCFKGYVLGICFGLAASVCDFGRFHV